jgi:hypothetical protein
MTVEANYDTCEPPCPSKIAKSPEPSLLKLSIAIKSILVFMYNPPCSVWWGSFYPKNIRTPKQI